MKYARGRESTTHRNLKRQVGQALIATSDWLVLPEYRLADVVAVSSETPHRVVAFEIECSNLRGFLVNVVRNRREQFDEQWIVVRTIKDKSYIESVLQRQTADTRNFVSGVILPEQIGEVIERLCAARREEDCDSEVTAALH